MFKKAPVVCVGLMLSCNVFAAKPPEKTFVTKNDFDAAITDLQEKISDILPTPIYEIGNLGPAGGIVFFVDSYGQHGLEAAPVDQSTRLQRTRLLWSMQSELMAKARGYNVGAREVNTLLIIAAHKWYATNYAAGSCANLVTDIEGVIHNGWFLPSMQELNLMWKNLADSDGDGANTGISDPANLGVFVAAGYWSSTEANFDYARLIVFDDGRKGKTWKDMRFHVRCARRF